MLFVEKLKKSPYLHNVLFLLNLIFGTCFANVLLEQRPPRWLTLYDEMKVMNQASKKITPCAVPQRNPPAAALVDLREDPAYVI
jgi:hypothetical protein